MGGNLVVDLWRNPVAANTGSVIGPRRVLVLPAVGHLGPPLSLDRLPDHRGEERSLHGGPRVPLDPAPVRQPSEPPLKGGDPASPEYRLPEFFHQPGGGVGVQRVEAVPPALVVERDEEQVAGRQRLEHRPAVLPVQHRIAQRAVRRPARGSAMHRLWRGASLACVLAPDRQRVMAVIDAPVMLRRLLYAKNIVVWTFITPGCAVIALAAGISG